MNHTTVVAECGVNHDGNLQIAMDLIWAAAQAGVDVVKFQIFNAELTARGDKDYYNLIAPYELPFKAFDALQAACAEAGVEFQATAFDDASLAHLAFLRPRRLKVSSQHVRNLPFLLKCKATRIPIWLSTGATNLDEVETAAHICDPEAILHCVSCYPSREAESSLEAIRVMQAAFPDKIIGWSDHTGRADVAPYAVAAGARIVEVHFTHSRAAKGPDHAASLDVDDLRRLVADVRRVERLMGWTTGRPAKSVQPGERKIREWISRRS